MIVTGANSCIDTAEINIQVNNPDNAGINQNICTGDTTQINVAELPVESQYKYFSSNLSTISAWPVDTTSYMVQE